MPAAHGAMMALFDLFGFVWKACGHNPGHDPQARSHVLKFSKMHRCIERSLRCAMGAMAGMPEDGLTNSH